MKKEERLEAARERVRVWKKGHPKSVVWQKARWYRRKKELVGRKRVGVGVGLKEQAKTVVVGREVLETHYGGIEGVDIGYAEKDGYGTIERKATGDSEGTLGATGEYTAGGGVRRVTGADRGVSIRGSGIKFGDEGGCVGGGQADELGTAGEDGGGGGQEVRTANEEATYRRLEELKERKARGGLNAGVEVELEM